jgi:hypothetical protein
VVERMVKDKIVWGGGKTLVRGGPFYKARRKVECRFDL